MSSDFPKIPNVVSRNCLIGEDFDVLKKTSMEKYNDKVFKFTHDRYIPNRRAINAECLQETKEDDFDITLSENDLTTMKKSKYQQTLKLIFYDQRKANGCRLNNHEKGNRSEDQRRKKSLLHLDWACKLTNIREKFLPDFETLEKKSFHRIRNYIWSSKGIIAASSNRKVCLYHPINGFTRALDVTDNVCLSFSSNGDRLAMAYRKSKRHIFQEDLFIFEMHYDALFKDEKLQTVKFRTGFYSDVTALCFTRNDEFLLCGTSNGKIYVLSCRSDENRQKWAVFKALETSHLHEIFKICYSATGRYMATLDVKGEFKIWNGGSWTYLYSYQHEKSRLYKHFEWHPYVENELMFGRQFLPALYLFNVTEKQIVASYTKWTQDWELTSFSFNPQTGQLAVCFYNEEDYINRVCLLASMSQVISSFDFDYIEGGLKLFWNSTGMMLGAGARSFRFAFWSLYQNHDFHVQMAKASSTKNSEKLLTLSDSKLLNIR